MKKPFLSPLPASPWGEKLRLAVMRGKLLTTRPVTQKSGKAKAPPLFYFNVFSKRPTSILPTAVRGMFFTPSTFFGSDHFGNHF